VNQHIALRTRLPIALLILSLPVGGRWLNGIVCYTSMQRCISRCSSHTLSVRYITFIRRPRSSPAVSIRSN